MQPQLSIYPVDTTQVNQLYQLAAHCLLYVEVHPPVQSIQSRRRCPDSNGSATTNDVSTQFYTKLLTSSFAREVQSLEVAETGEFCVVNFTSPQLALMAKESLEVYNCPLANSPAASNPDASECKNERHRSEIFFRTGWLHPEGAEQLLKSAKEKNRRYQREREKSLSQEVCVMLEGVFNRHEEASSSSDWKHELSEEMQLQLTEFSVKDVTIDDWTDAGRVFIEFLPEHISQVAVCQKKLNGVRFGSRTVVARVLTLKQLLACLNSRM